jgi:hypothetical protein
MSGPTVPTPPDLQQALDRVHIIGPTWTIGADLIDRHLELRWKSSNPEAVGYIVLSRPNCREDLRKCDCQEIVFGAWSKGVQIFWYKLDRGCEGFDLLYDYAAQTFESLRNEQLRRQREDYERQLREQEERESSTRSKFWSR